jgi:outer membrane murein-binding lipoprotein Lpp
MFTMNEDDHRAEIERLEADIDQLAAKIESCRKSILAGRIAIAGGGVVLIARLIGAIQFDSAVVGIAAAAVLGGIVVAGSNRSTQKEAALELTAIEAQRAGLIGQLDLRLVPDQGT